MEIKTERYENGVSVLVNGRLDSLTSPLLESHILPMVPVEKKLILNLANVEYVSSAGLRVFLMIAKTSNKHACEFVLCEVNENILSVIEMSGFGSILTIKGNLPDALS
jgi:anti-anti-sigma factor